MMLSSPSDLLVSGYNSFTLRMAHKSLRKEYLRWGHQVINVIYCLLHVIITVALLKDSGPMQYVCALRCRWRLLIRGAEFLSYHTIMKEYDRSDFEQ